MKNDDEFIVEFTVRWTAISEKLPDEDVPVLVTDGSNYETASWIAGEDGPVWFLGSFEVELPWEPEWWVDHPPLPRRRHFSELGYTVGEDEKDEDGYDVFYQWDKAGNQIFWTAQNGQWEAFDDNSYGNDPDVYEPFFAVDYINKSALDEAWLMLMEMREEDNENPMG